MLVKAHFFYARYFIPQWVYSWSTLVAGDEQPYWPRQQATQSMKVNIFCFSCECTISEVDLQRNWYVCQSPSNKVFHGLAV